LGLAVTELLPHALGQKLEGSDRFQAIGLKFERLSQNQKSKVEPLIDVPVIDVPEREICKNFELRIANWGLLKPIE
jgi:hypothetical protein